MGKQHDVGNVEKPWVDGRFMRVNIKACTCDTARLQRINQRVFVNQLTA